MGKRWRKYQSGIFSLQQLKGRAVGVCRGSDGRRHRFRLEAATETEARSALDALARKHSIDAAKGSKTIGEIYAAYEGDREKDGKLIANFKESWKALKPRFGNLSPDTVDADLCRAYAAERIKAGKSPGTVWTELTRLRSCLNWASKRKVIKEAPYVWVPSKPPPRNRVLTRPEVDRLIAGCQMPHVRLFVILALTTGGRHSALLELTWSRVDFEAGSIDLKSIEAVNPLTKAVRKTRAIVPMNNLARAALQDARSAALSDYVIEWDGERIQNIRKGFSEAVKRAKLGTDVTPHVLRHTAASWMETEEIPMSQISRFLGHKREETSRTIYAKPDVRLLKAASKVVDLGTAKRAKRFAKP